MFKSDLHFALALHPLTRYATRSSFVKGFSLGFSELDFTLDGLIGQVLLCIPFAPFACCPSDPKRSHPPFLAMLTGASSSIVDLSDPAMILLDPPILVAYI
jgi:hypothetical protein